MIEDKKDYVVKSLSTFFKYIETKGLRDYIFRGEAEEYNDRIASWFRLNRNVNYDAISMQNEFKSKTIMNLSSHELNHFSAFCQHHGIPTNLLDFSYSPLVSLFFASQQSKSKSGYIHLIKKDRIINISDLITNNENFMLSDIYGNEKLYKSMVSKLDMYFRKNDSKITELLSELIENFSLWNYSFMSAAFVQHKHVQRFRSEGVVKSEVNFDLLQLQNQLDNGVAEEIYSSLNLLSQNVYENDDNIAKGSKFKNAAELYMLLLRQYFVNLVFEKNRGVVFKCGLVFVYTPPEIFSRLKSQQGLLVYQLYSYSSVDSQIIFRQNIETDVVIKIQDKNKINQQLDLLGINGSTIYNDFDNIAKYIKEKYK